MSCHQPVLQEARPGTARVRVTDLTGSGLINPTPDMDHSESEAEVETFDLSPEKLELLCGTGDLSNVTSLEISVDTRENSLGNIGAYLPRLVQFRINNSTVTSIRDLGTTLSHLQVLRMPLCSLQDLNGISTFSSLKELYVAYNSLSDLSQVGMLENLQLLDLEGNDVDDLVQVQYLRLCGKLQTLTLEGNPVCFCPNSAVVQISNYSYRAAVRELIPQLRYLDDVQVEEEGHHSSSCTTEDDWAVLRHSIRDLDPPRADTDEEKMPHDTRPCSRAASARLASPSRSLVRLSSGSRPHTCSTPMTATRSGVLSPPGSRHGSADSHLATVAAETSSLTHGAGKILFCGNPVQALRARREKLMTAPSSSSLGAREFPIHVPEHTYDLEEPDGQERADVFAELRAWREQHSKRLQAIEKERSPQVLAIQHSDEEDEREDHSEDEHPRSVENDNTGKKEEAHNNDNKATCSADSALGSLSPEVHLKGVPLPDIAARSVSPNILSGPSPPLRGPETAGYRKLPGIRVRRLQQHTANHRPLPVSSCVADTPRAGKSPPDQDKAFMQVKQSAHIPSPPPLINQVKGQIDPCAEKVSVIPSPHTFRVLDRPAATRPHTAGAALQKHHLSHLVQPCRGRSQPK